MIDLGVYKGKYFHINPRVSCYLLSRSLVKQGEGREQEIKTRKICPNKRMNSWFIPYVIWSFMSGGMDDLSEKEHGLSCFLWRRLSGEKTLTQPNTVAMATQKVTTKRRMWWKAPPMVVLPPPSPPVTARHRNCQTIQDAGDFQDHRHYRKPCTFPLTHIADLPPTSQPAIVCLIFPLLTFVICKNCGMHSYLFLHQTTEPDGDPSTKPQKNTKTAQFPQTVH